MAKDYLPAAIPQRGPTDAAVYFDRRRFIQAAAAGLAAAALGCERRQERVPFVPLSLEDDPSMQAPFERPEVFPAARSPEPELPEGIDHAITPREVAGSHNNFYEFLPGSAGRVGPRTGDFVVDPWTLEIGGECAKPATLDLDDLFAFEHEERLYHFRCVERWGMNVPWTGFPLRRLLEAVEPTGHAKFVRFVTANRPEQMPGLRDTPAYPWPYHEGLRLDEAMHELAMVVTGAYGRPLLKQHGAPVRIIVPWKYGYKSPKSIVRIELVREQPKTFWMIQPHEYGFLSNVNPNVPHPRWSQAETYWVDRPDSRFPTPIFNGYGDAVAALYPDEPTEPQKPLRRGQTAR